MGVSDVAKTFQAIPNFDDDVINAQVTTNQNVYNSHTNTHIHIRTYRCYSNLDLFPLVAVFLIVLFSVESIPVGVLECPPEFYGCIVLNLDSKIFSFARVLDLDLKRAPWLLKIFRRNFPLDEYITTNLKGLVCPL